MNRRRLSAAVLGYFIELHPRAMECGGQGRPAYLTESGCPIRDDRVYDEHPLTAVLFAVP